MEGTIAFIKTGLIILNNFEEEIMKTIKMAFENDCSKLMVLSESGHVIGFAFFNICVGMESAGRYLWLNEMHIQV